MKIPCGWLPGDREVMESLAVAEHAVWGGRFQVAEQGGVLDAACCRAAGAAQLDTAGVSTSSRRGAIRHCRDPDE